MHENLPTIERAEVSRLWLAQPDHTEKLVVGWIGHRNGVGELLGRVDAVSVANRNVRGASCPGSLPGYCRYKRATRKKRDGQSTSSHFAAPHNFTDGACSLRWDLSSPRRQSGLSPR